MKMCTNCGSTLQERRGTFSFEPPPNILGGTMVVENALWKECENCGDRVLPADLDNALQALAIKRQKNTDRLDT